MNSDARVAIFVDAENLGQWLKAGGAESLLEELSSLGTVVVRKAYARWTCPTVQSHQLGLNSLGFELVHSFHPVSGKNSADIQIAVDVMQYAMKEDLQWIVLATGDSDFSPLFRRLREIGMKVVGVGPRSALSETVKSSCSRFIYTDVEPQGTQTDEAAVRASAFDDAVDVLEKALKTFDGPANCCTLKPRMLSIDSAFDEKQLGFKSFSDFLKAAGVKLEQHNQIWFASLCETTQPQQPSQAAGDPMAHKETVEDVSGIYRAILRKRNWRALPTARFIECLLFLKAIEPSVRAELPDKAVALCEGRLPRIDLRKTLDLLMKAGLMEQTGSGEESEKLWKVRPLEPIDAMKAVDLALLARLLGGPSDAGATLKKKHLRPLLMGQYTDTALDALITEAKTVKPSAR